MVITHVFLFTAFSICLIQGSFGMPRDSSVVKTEDVQEINNVGVKSKAESTTAATADNFPNKEVMIPGRVSCDFTEPTEDPICQAHCFRKGYSYGLCTSKTCSCI